MKKSPTRRAFIQSATVAAGATIGATVTATSASAQSQGINPNARSLMPDGKILTREEILQKLGLNARTTADGWLVVVGCGLNGAALTAKQLDGLVKRGAVKKEALDPQSLKMIQ
jgi:hypothetical protein